MKHEDCMRLDDVRMTLLMPEAPGKLMETVATCRYSAEASV